MEAPPIEIFFFDFGPCVRDRSSGFSRSLDRKTRSIGTKARNLSALGLPLNVHILRPTLDATQNVSLNWVLTFS
jgi:hypothetical protein